MQIRQSNRTSLRSINIKLTYLEQRGVNTYRENLKQRASISRLFDRKPKRR